MEIKTLRDRQRFAIGLDEDCGDDDIDQLVPMILWVPNRNEHEHEHIGLTWEGAEKLHGWLTRVLRAKRLGLPKKVMLDLDKE